VSGMVIFLIGVVLGMLALGGLVVTWAVYAPSAAELAEKARLHDEAQKASWRMHQQATQAFAQMLDVSRQRLPGDSPGRDGTEWSSAADEQWED
jgi:hypothetical protein